MPNKTALSVADAYFQHIVCGSECRLLYIRIRAGSSENNLMQELCLLCGAHKTRTTPYHLASDGLVERFNRMMLAMFAGENREDCRR